MSELFVLHIYLQLTVDYSELFNNQPVFLCKGEGREVGNGWKEVTNILMEIFIKTCLDFCYM